jgi:hypothetical protein
MCALLIFRQLQNLSRVEFTSNECLYNSLILFDSFFLSNNEVDIYTVCVGCTKQIIVNAFPLCKRAVTLCLTCLQSYRDHNNVSENISFRFVTGICDVLPS